MALQQYSRVRVRTERFSSDGVRKGDLGFIIEVYPDGAYEVEFTDPQGITVAQVVATDDDLESAEE